MDVSSVTAQGSAMSTDQVDQQAQVLAMRKQLEVQKQEGQNAVELIQSADVKKGGVSLYA